MASLRPRDPLLPQAAGTKACRGTRGAQQGFGLLEALVAMVLLATAGTATFAWVNVNLDTVSRLQRRDTEDALRAQLAAWAQTLNPHARGPAEGADELTAGLPVHWRTQVLVAPRPVPPLPGGSRTPFRVGLVSVTVSAPGPDGDVVWEGTRVAVERDEDVAVEGALRAPR